MRSHALRAVFGLAVTLAVTVPVFAIVNGAADTANDFPNVCSIVVTRQPTGFPPLDLPQSFSSGTLIHPRVLMTAGHSIGAIHGFIAKNGLELSDFAVVFTPDVHDASATKYRIEEIRIHPDFSGRHGESSIDVGVLILTEAVDGITPVELPAKGYLDTLDLDRGPSEAKPEFAIVGYGTTLVPETVALLPPGERRYAISTFKSLRNRYLMLSQNFALDEGGIGRGDSGGPAFWERSDGSLVQVGVVSDKDTAAATLGVYVRTDLESVRSFVQKAIDDAQGD